MSRAARLIGACAATGMLVACASVPRGPASDLADAGLAATNAFSTDVRQTAAQIRAIEVTDTFTNTYNDCVATPDDCKEDTLSGGNYEKGRKLATAIEFRAKAITALGKAYKALKTEAGYDARQDLVGATNDAIGGVNNFASAVGLGAVPLQPIIGLAVGLLADRNQRRRIVAGSREISAVTERMQAALAKEAEIFDSLTGFIVDSRTDAKLAVVNAGLVSNSEIVSPLITGLGLKPVAGIDAIVAKSPATQAAIRAMLKAQARDEVEATKAKYRASIGALGALVEAHGELEADQGVSLADVERFLGELDVALGATKKE